MERKSLALITGSAHRLGKVFAQKLADMGYAILLHYKDSEQDALKTEWEIKEKGLPVFLVQADLADMSGIDQVIQAVKSCGHPLKVLVNSASNMKKVDLNSISPEEWDASFGLNLRAPFFLSQKASQMMEEGSLIINITDAGVKKVWIGYPAYILSKAGLEVMTRLMAKAYAPRIRVNAIAPGLVLPAPFFPEGEWEKLIKATPMQSRVTEAQIAQAMEFLLENPSITGQTIVVDGGYSLR